MGFSRGEKLSNAGGQEKLPSDAACPIGLGKVHCQKCWFWRGGRCDYRRIMIEKEPSQKGG
jgi:hypothetical protein